MGISLHILAFDFNMTGRLSKLHCRMSLNGTPWWGSVTQTLRDLVLFTSPRREECKNDNSSPDGEKPYPLGHSCQCVKYTLIALFMLPWAKAHTWLRRSIGQD